MRSGQLCIHRLCAGVGGRLGRGVKGRGPEYRVPEGRAFYRRASSAIRASAFRRTSSGEIALSPRITIKHVREGDD